MKKQILFLALFSLALIFAGTNKSYGQYDPQLSAAPTGCPNPTLVAAACAVADALHPIPGTLYPYTVAVTNTGAAPLIHWFVTSNPAFIVDNASTGGGTLSSSIETIAGNSAFIQAVSGSYNVPGNTSNTVDITWKSFPSTTDVFLVAYVKGDPTCTDNIQAYKIEPVQVFTLDLAALTAAGAANTIKLDCVSPVVDAKYVAATSIVEMDYGINYVYFIVNAANFAHSWLPSFDVTATNLAATLPAIGDGTLAVDWAYPLQSTDPDGVGPLNATWHATTATGNVYTSGATDPVKPISTTATGVGAGGECIVVRVTVDHNKNQTLADIVVNFAVDGVMYNFAGTNYSDLTLGDIHYQAGLPAQTPSQDCPWVDLFANDKTTYTLTRRPTITDAIPNTPAVTDFIPKN